VYSFPGELKPLRGCVRAYVTVQIPSGPLYQLDTLGAVPRAYEPFRGLCESENEILKK